MKHFFIFLLIMLFGYSAASADSFRSIDEAQLTIEKAIQTFSDENFQEGCNLIKPYWPASPITVDGLAVEAKQQWGLVKENYGKKIGMEFIKTKSVGESLVRFIHIVKFQRFILKFETTIYNSDKGWIITNFTFNDKVSELFN